MRDRHAPAWQILFRIPVTDPPRARCPGPPRSSVASPSPAGHPALPDHDHHERTNEFPRRLQPSRLAYAGVPSALRFPGYRPTRYVSACGQLAREVPEGIGRRAATRSGGEAVPLEVSTNRRRDRRRSRLLPATATRSGILDARRASSLRRGTVSNVRLRRDAQSRPHALRAPRWMDDSPHHRVVEVLHRASSLVEDAEARWLGSDASSLATRILGSLHPGRRALLHDPRVHSRESSQGGFGGAPGGLGVQQRESGSPVADAGPPRSCVAEVSHAGQSPAVRMRDRHAPAWLKKAMPGRARRSECGTATLQRG